MRDGCLCACVAVQATMVNAQSGNAMRNLKVVRGLLALPLMMINVQTGGIKGERKKLPRALSDTPDPKAQRRCVRTYAEDTKTGNGAAAADDFCVVPLCIELCPFAETDDSPPTWAASLVARSPFPRTLAFGCSERSHCGLTSERSVKGIFRWE